MKEENKIKLNYTNELSFGACPWIDEETSDAVKKLTMNMTKDMDCEITRKLANSMVHHQDYDIKNYKVKIEDYSGTQQYKDTFKYMCEIHISILYKGVSDQILFG